MGKNANVVTQAEDQRWEGQEHMEPLRVGIVGTGWMGHVHANAWSENAPRGEVVAIADVSPERAHHLAAEIGRDVPIFADLQTMLAGTDIDAVDICLPHHLHTEAIIAAARAGKAILCEKPLCTNLEDAAAIREALQASSSVFMAAHNQLFQPSLIEARRLLAAGALGRPFVFRSIEAVQNRGFASGRHARDIGGGESPWIWRADTARMGGGEVIDTGWHATYRLLALADDRPVEVSAMMDRFAVQQLAAEDTGIILVRFASGAIGQILTSWAFAPVGSWHFEVGAEHGSLAGAQNRLVHQLHGWPAPVEFAPFTHTLALTFASEVTHFLDVVQRGAESRAPFDHAARVLQLTLGAYAAAEEHCVIRLPEDPTQPGVPATDATLARA
jgi:predicted dehydrogenase